MPRNGSGTYSTPNSFSSGTTIESASVNANFSDVGTELTNSLPRDGQAAMTGQLKAANGTAAAPGITFGTDTDTGFYRASANTIGVAIGGAAGGTIDASGFANADGDYATHFPSGTVMLFVQTAAPTGWTKSTDHNDKALRVVSGTASSGGSTAFSSVMAARTIAQANLPNITISASGLTASSSTTVSLSGGTIGGTGSTSWGADGGGLSGPVNPSGISASATTTTTIGGTVSLGGSGTALDFAVQYVDTIIAVKD